MQLNLYSAAIVWEITCDSVNLKHNSKNNMGMKNEESVMFCRNCGKELRDEAEFCSNCGMKIATDPSGENSVHNLIINVDSPEKTTTSGTIQGSQTNTEKVDKKHIAIGIAVLVAPRLLVLIAIICFFLSVYECIMRRIFYGYQRYRYDLW